MALRIRLFPDDGRALRASTARKAANTWTGLLIDSTWDATDLRETIVYENCEQGGGRVRVTFCRCLSPHKIYKLKVKRVSEGVNGRGVTERFRHMGAKAAAWQS